MDKAQIWLNGRMQPAAAARIDPADRGLLLGDGVFETLAVRAGKVRDGALHFARLAAGAALLRLELPFDEAGMAAILSQVIATNGLDEGALRLTLTRGPGPRGLLPPDETQPTLMVTGFAQAPATGALTLIVSSLRRDERSPLCGVKSLNYLPNILARLEAREQGADDAILLNHAGRVAGATAGNVFLHDGQAWLTPPLADGVLPGIRRARLMQAGLVREAPLSPADMTACAGLAIGNVLSLRAGARLNDAALNQDAAALAALAAATRV